MRRRQALNEELAKCTRELRYLGVKVPSSSEISERLIISTGDISDVDGFCALAEYARTGADVLFVMNYPAYIGRPAAEQCTECDTGLGYNYGITQFLASTCPPSNDNRYYNYTAVLQKYSNNVKKVLTDLAYAMAKLVWESMPAPKGNLFFCVGGINKINPFHYSAIKNEILAYADIALKMTDLIYLNEKETISVGNETPANLPTLVSSYTDIYIDFNGSMAFFDDTWVQMISEAAKDEKIRGVFVAGGVYASEQPKTMSAIKDTLNRMSCCTMNQLYHPARTSTFFTLMSELNINMYFVPNNEVEALSNTERCIQFLQTNGINSTPVLSLCRHYYNLPHNPPKKIFDFNVASCLRTFMNDDPDFKYYTAARTLHFNACYGVALIGKERERWPSVYLNFNSKVQERIEDLQTKGSNAFADTFKDELVTLSKIKCSSCNIYIFQFAPLEPTLKLTMKSFKRPRKPLEDEPVYLEKPDLKSIMWFVNGFGAINGTAENLITKKCVIKHPDGYPIIGRPPQDPDSEEYIQSIEYEHGEILAKKANDRKNFQAWKSWYDANITPDLELKLRILKNTLCNWKIMKDWYKDLDPSFLFKKDTKNGQWGIMIQSYDFFGTNQGFIKFQAFVVNKIAFDNGRSFNAASSPGVTFLRSAAVTMLPVLTHEDEPTTKYTILTVQARVPIGIARFKEIPAGMTDESNNFSGVVAKEMKEETGLTINIDQMFCLSDALMGNHKGMYPSSGGCSESIKIYSWRYHFTTVDFNELKRKMETETHGQKEEGEFIQLCLVKLDELHKHAPDAKALSALALYNIYLKQLQVDGRSETIHSKEFKQA